MGRDPDHFIKLWTSTTSRKAVHESIPGHLWTTQQDMETKTDIDIDHHRNSYVMLHFCKHFTISLPQINDIRMALIQSGEWQISHDGEDCFIAENATIVGDVVMGDQCSVCSMPSSVEMSLYQIKKRARWCYYTLYKIWRKYPYKYRNNVP